MGIIWSAEPMVRCGDTSRRWASGASHCCLCCDIGKCMPCSCVLYYLQYVVHFSRSIEQQKQIYSCKLRVWCGVATMNGQTFVFMY